MMLHTVNKSPFERNTLDSCLAHAVTGSGLLLIEDGVYAAVKGSPAAQRLAERGKGLALFVLGPDLKARGLDPANLIGGTVMVDFEGFVDLTVKYRAVQGGL